MATTSGLSHSISGNTQRRTSSGCHSRIVVDELGLFVEGDARRLGAHQAADAPVGAAGPDGERHVPVVERTAVFLDLLG